MRAAVNTQFARIAFELAANTAIAEIAVLGWGRRQIGVMELAKTAVAKTAVAAAAAAIAPAVFALLH